MLIIQPSYVVAVGKPLCTKRGLYWFSNDQKRGGTRKELSYLPQKHCRLDQPLILEKGQKLALDNAIGVLARISPSFRTSAPIRLAFLLKLPQTKDRTPGYRNFFCSLKHFFIARFESMWESNKAGLIPLLLPNFIWICQVFAYWNLNC